MLVVCDDAEDAWWVWDVVSDLARARKDDSTGCLTMNHIVVRQQIMCYMHAEVLIEGSMYDPNPLTVTIDAMQLRYEKRLSSLWT